MRRFYNGHTKREDHKRFLAWRYLVGFTFYVPLSVKLASGGGGGMGRAWCTYPCIHYTAIYYDAMKDLSVLFTEHVSQFTIKFLNNERRRGRETQSIYNNKRIVRI